jgi:hypothetical protein
MGNQTLTIGFQGKLPTSTSREFESIEFVTFDGDNTSRFNVGNEGSPVKQIGSLLETHLEELGKEYGPFRATFVLDGEITRIIYEDHLQHLDIRTMDIATYDQNDVMRLIKRHPSSSGVAERRAKVAFDLLTGA